MKKRPAHKFSDRQLFRMTPEAMQSVSDYMQFVEDNYHHTISVNAAMLALILFGAPVAMQTKKSDDESGGDDVR